MFRLVFFLEDWPTPTTNCEDLRKLAMDLYSLYLEDFCLWGPVTSLLYLRWLLWRD